MAKPDFLFIGPSKSGSSWFFELLKSHPDVFVPKAKDTYFFNKYYDKGAAWYESFFSSASRGQSSGEVCHDYLSSEEAIKRIYKYNPNMKLVCCLREPVSRAVSSYRYFQKNGMALNSFESAINKYPEIYSEGLYGQHLKNVFEYFPRNQVLILYFECIAERPLEVSEDLFQFIGVSSDFISPCIDQVINKAATARSTILARLVKEGALLVRELGFPTVVSVLRANPIVSKILYKKNDNRGVGELQLPAEMIIEYDKDVQQLQDMLNVDLSSWMSR